MKYHWELSARDLVLPLVATLFVLWIAILLPLPDGATGRMFFSFLHLMGSIFGTIAVWLVFFACAKKTLR